jgi:hypothetical protein
MDVMRQERGEERRARAVAPGRGFLYGTTLAAVPHLQRTNPAPNKKGPLTRAFSVNNLRGFSRDGEVI